MSQSRTYLLLGAVLALGVCLLVAPAGCGRDQGVTGDFYYKIETGNVQSGYAVLDTATVVEHGEVRLRLEAQTHTEFTLLGSDVDSEGRLIYDLLPPDKRVVRIQGESVSGTQSTTWNLEVSGGRVSGSSPLKGKDWSMDLPPDVIIENMLFFDHVTRDLVDAGLTEKTYRVLDVLDLEVRECRYEKQGEETLHLGGADYPVIVVDQAVEETNTLVRLWIDTRTAMAVKVLQQDGNVITLAGSSVVDGVRRVNMDKYILDETNVAIADVPAISYMKVRARIRPIGLRPTPESLNVPGQSFQGTVENNLIEGTFEIEHRRFDGTGAPPFPVLDPPAGFGEYLGADNVYEADDTVLVEKARKLTAGAADTWEAATRLSRWVTDEISYAIPGGGTARNTYNLRAGECGAHSILLATFCRAVGIPARVVWGCMYTPDRGGAFGQHGWTEVHMGPAGWIPVDATAGETDYVDSGHIRVAELVSIVSRLNAQEFEILDYRLSGGGTNSAEAAERYASFCGTYLHEGSPARYEVKVMDGCLVVNLPSRALLALNDPDDRGRWVCKMTKGLYLTFDRGDEGEITGLVIHERASLPRRERPEAKDREVPPDLAPYIGRYHHAATGKDFEVISRGSGLALRHPGLDKTFDLEPEADGSWRTPNAPYTALFVVDDGGKVVTLILEEENTFLRTTPG